MARIPVYEQQTGATTSLGGVPDFSAGASAASGLARALQSVADDQLQLKAFELQKREERAAVQASETVTAIRGRWTEELLKRQEAAPEGADGFTPGVLKDFDTEMEEAVKAAPTERARNWLKERLGQVRLGIQQDALAFEARKGVEFKVSGLERSRDQARIAAEFRPEDFGSLMQEQIEAINASGLSADARLKLAREAEQSIASASVQGMVRLNPRAALQELNREDTENAAVRALGFDQRQALRRAAEAEIRQREAEARARNTEARQAMDDRLRDMNVAAQLGIPVTDVPPEAVLKSLYGDHEGAQRYQAAQRAAALSSTVAEMNTLPSAELLQRVAATRPTQVEGAADQAQMHGLVTSRAEAIVKAREQDAGGYLVQYSPAVRDAWNAFQKQDDPQAADRYLKAVRAEKERLGIASQDVLPAGYASAVVDRLTRPQGAETLAVAMAREAERWGPAWSQVYRQVSKDLPDAALVIGSGIPKRAADTLALMSQRSKEELKALIPAGRTQTELDDAVAEGLADLASTFGPEGAPTLTAVQNSAARVAIGYMAGGSSFGDAIEQAVNDVANSRYTFLEFRDHAYRVPVDVDADVVDDAASYFLANYSQLSGTVEVPLGVPEEIILGQASARIRREGYWRTAPDESGLRLYLGNAPVPGPGGTPVQLSWEQLLEISQEAGAQRARRNREEAERRFRRSGR